MKYSWRKNHNPINLRVLSYWLRPCARLLEFWKRRLAEELLLERFNTAMMNSGTGIGWQLYFIQTVGFALFIAGLLFLNGCKAERSIHQSKATNRIQISALPSNETFQLTTTLKEFDSKMRDIEFKFSKRKLAGLDAREIDSLRQEAVAKADSESALALTLYLQLLQTREVLISFSNSMNRVGVDFAK